MTVRARPRIERTLVRQTLAGLRPFRAEGFRVEAEPIGDTLVVHNYGHGGSGITLAYGTAELAVALALESRHRTASVIGAGAVGLATARLLQEAGFSVRVYGDALTPATTSDVAGALWGIFALVDEAHATAENAVRIEAAARASYRHFASLDPLTYGIRRIPLFLVGAEPELPWEMRLTPELFPVTIRDEGHHPFRVPRALETETLMVEPARFLRALRDDVERAGGLVITRRFASVEEILALGSPVVVNCTGIGARQLFGDDTLVPIKGELALLEPQPAIDYAVVSLDEDAYVLPRAEALVVGGSFLRGDWSLTVGAAELEAMLGRARGLWASG